MVWVQLLGGLALITFGVRFLRKGFDRLFGGRVAVWLQKTARTPLRAMAAGVLTGTVAPSSTGLSVIVNHILSTGKVKTEQMLAVLLGANIGLTVLANIVALDVESLAGVLLFFGVIGFQFSKRQVLRGVGQCLLSFGFIFLAMTFLSNAAMGISEDAKLRMMFLEVEKFPWLLCLAAAGLGVLLQSSTATVGLGIGLSQGGVLGTSLFMGWIVGTNLGLGITALIVSWPNREGRVLGYANLLVKILVGVPLMVFSASIYNFHTGGVLPLANQLALAHTGFNLLTGVVALPLLKPLLSVSRRWLVSGGVLNDEPKKEKSFLNAACLDSPGSALELATKEVVRMTEVVRSMLEGLWRARERRDLKGLQSVAAKDDRVDRINQKLAIYLTQICEGLSEVERAWRYTLLSFSGELESVGDILEKELCGIAVKQIRRGWVLGSEEEDALEMLYRKTLGQFDNVISLLGTQDVSLAVSLIGTKDEISAWCGIQKREHYQKMRPDPGEVDSTLGYLDLIDALRRINKHLATAAHSFHPSSAAVSEWLMEDEPRFFEREDFAGE